MGWVRICMPPLSDITLAKPVASWKVAPVWVVPNPTTWAEAVAAAADVTIASATWDRIRIPVTIMQRSVAC
jgi:hypothetical protein